MAPPRTTAKPPLHHPALPAYIRLPRSGNLCPHCGLTRSALDILTRPQEINNFRPPVESKIMHQTGTGRGVRLVNYASLIGYLDSLPQETT